MKRLEEGVRHSREGEVLEHRLLTPDRDFEHPPRIGREPLTRIVGRREFWGLEFSLSADTLDPVGLYFGTRGGQLYGSTDEGESWRAIAEFLPPILCVKTAIVD